MGEGGSSVAGNVEAGGIVKKFVIEEIILVSVCVFDGDREIQQSHVVSKGKDCAPGGMVGATDGTAGGPRRRGDQATKEEDIGKRVSEVTEGGAMVKGKAKGKVKVLCFGATNVINSSGGLSKEESGGGSCPRCVWCECVVCISGQGEACEGISEGGAAAGCIPGSEQRSVGCGGKVGERGEGWGVCGVGGWSGERRVRGRLCKGVRGVSREKVGCTKGVWRAKSVVEEAAPLFCLVIVRNRCESRARGVKELGEPKRWAM